jgi:hypothetical protein
VQKTLKKDNIVNEIEGKGKIEEIPDITLLKETIQTYPDDMYLIDNTKIIKKDSISNKFSFLKPKDAIEQTFLEQYGIGEDLELESFSELGSYIKSKVEDINLDDIDEKIKKLDTDIDEKDSNNINTEDIDDSISSVDISEPLEEDIIEDDEDKNLFDDFNDDESKEQKELENTHSHIDITDEDVSEFENMLDFDDEPLTNDDMIDKDEDLELDEDLMNIDIEEGDETPEINDLMEMDIDEDDNDEVPEINDLMEMDIDENESDSLEEDIDSVDDESADSEIDNLMDINEDDLLDNNTDEDLMNIDIDDNDEATDIDDLMAMDIDEDDLNNELDTKDLTDVDTDNNENENDIVKNDVVEENIQSTPANTSSDTKIDLDNLSPISNDSDFDNISEDLMLSAFSGDDDGSSLQNDIVLNKDNMQEISTILQQALSQGLEIVIKTKK